MADSYTGNINLRKPEVGAAHDTWGGLAGLNGDLDIIDAIFLATGLSEVAPPAGHPQAGVPGVGLRIGNGMVLNIEGYAYFKDSEDNTKVGRFRTSNLSTGTFVDLQFPTVGGTIATVEAATVLVKHPVGTILSGYYGPTPPPGFIFLNGWTLGDASSGAVHAHVITERLFKHLWAITAQAQCPVYDAGSGTTGSRGASANDDWLAHKRLTLPNHSGMVSAGRDNLSGVPYNRLTGYNALGFYGGNQVHVLTEEEIPSHYHPIEDEGHNHAPYAGGAENYFFGNEGVDFGGVAGGNDLNIYGRLNTDTRYTGITYTGWTGGDDAIADGPAAQHNNIQPTIAVDVVIAL